MANIITEMFKKRARGSAGLLPFDWKAFRHAYDTEGENAALELIKPGFDYNSRVTEVNTGATPLTWSLLCAKTERIALKMLQSGADYTAQDNNGYNGLHMAVFYGKTEALRRMISDGADVNAMIGEETLIGSAALCSQGAVVRLLLEKGADAEKVNAQGLTPLLLAAREAGLGIDVLKALIAWPVALDTPDSCGQTALIYAASEGCHKGVEALLAAGANPLLKDATGRTAQRHAPSIQMREVLAAAEKARMDPDAFRSATVLENPVTVRKPLSLVGQRTG